ncbi:PREDICTED: protein AUXIN RESPONSE 4 [Tarenaya hassleriana]|uniref:protein AUXIN RESPONSE 4 n=1 Tax=Tarenaya hassleriana TaxID=28532 RepID=UPI00053C7A51|nr:PREDICTED: protein AUXIN RESPONSE 4 [Tarenaya hassleriana]
MAIITEEEEDKRPLTSPENKAEHKEAAKPESIRKNRKPQTQNPFTFWFYFTIVVSLTTFFFVSLSTLSTRDDPRSWFLSLPPSLRQYYSDGRTIKVQVNSNESPIEVFVAESGPIGSENVVVVHGLGLSSYAFRDMIRSMGSKGVHAVAVDLPGNGFSDKSTVVIGGDREVGALARFKEAYGLIKEKGVFWAFDQMVETGELPYEAILKLQNANRRTVKSIELGSEETARVLGQVIDTMGLAPVHLVVHDSALGLASNWVSENSAVVRSVTLIDTGITPALPLWVLNVPVMREVLLGFSFGFQKLVGICCSTGMTPSQADAHRILLKGRNGRRAVVSSMKKLNHSFDIARWGDSDGMNGIPMQVVWSSEWSKEWSDEGNRVAKALPKAKFVSHLGSRWPQESNSDELAKYVAEFVASLPRSIRRVAEEPVPENVQRPLDEAKSGNHHHHHHDHDHEHGHAQGAGYMDAYGLGHGWAA